MRKEVARPKEALTNIKHGKFDMKDVLMIMASSILGFLSQIFIPEVLRVPYIMSFPITLYLLFSPSGIHAKKNYQVALQVLLKDRKIYHAITLSKEEEHEI
jgi:hypothetical protein